MAVHGEVVEKKAEVQRRNQKLNGSWFEHRQLGAGQGSNVEEKSPKLEALIPT